MSDDQPTSEPQAPRDEAPASESAPAPEASTPHEAASPEPGAPSAEPEAAAEPTDAASAEPEAANEPTEAASAEPEALSAPVAAATATPAPEHKHAHEKHPIDPTGIPAIVPPTLAVFIACTIYGFLALGHVVGNWTLAIALIVMVAGIILVAGYMELITGAPASMEEDFDEHTLSEDDPRSHGKPSAHDLPLDNPARAELLA